MQLQTALAERVRSLEEALANVKALADVVADVRVLQVDPQRPELLGEGRNLLHAALGRVVHAQLLPELLRALRSPELEALETNRADRIASAAG